MGGVGRCPQSARSTSRISILAGTAERTIAEAGGNTKQALRRPDMRRRTRPGSGDVRTATAMGGIFR
jgi:hypothetical protein